MTTALLVGLTLTSALLTVTLLGVLRRLVELQRRITDLGSTRARGTAGIRIEEGDRIPGDVMREIADGSETHLFTVLAEGCPHCELVANYARSHADAPWLAAVNGPRSGALRQSLEGSVRVLSRSASKIMLERFQVREAPVVIAERQGLVEGWLQGESISAQTLEQLIRRPQIQRPEPAT